MDARNALKSQAAVIRHLSHTNSHLRGSVQDLKSQYYAVCYGRTTAAEKYAAEIILSEREQCESALSDAAELRCKQAKTIAGLEYEIGCLQRRNSALHKDLMREQAGRADDVRNWRGMALAGLIGTACSTLLYICSAAGLL